ncbi:MAG: M66 family metalloprotease [Deltaproteobacteria bacterium]|nr:M66 family metalloprotease [Deltaproteobacteria bacterium]
MNYALFTLSLLTLVGCSGPAQPEEDGGTLDGTVISQDAMTPLGDSAPSEDIPGIAQDAARPGEVRLAEDLAVSEVAMFQGVRVAVFARGAIAPMAGRNAPLIAGRAAAVRAYVTPAAGFRARMVTAELLWDEGGTTSVLRESRMISGASSDMDPAGVFTFRVDAARVRSGARYAVRVLSDTGPTSSGAGTSDARVPRDGTLAALDLSPVPGSLRVTLVPVRWTGDRSNRLPDTSPEQLGRMRTLLIALYPLTAVDFTVHAPIDFGSTTFTGNVNFGSLNGVIANLRDREAPGDDVYYFGLVAPATTREIYCGRSCVTGQSYVVSNPTDASIRVGSGVGFTGDDTAWTFAHELGHLFGREHAPCSTSGADRAYPHALGRIGVWGFDPRDATFFSPMSTTDFMGYCDPQWVSDYTYRALYSRAVALRGTVSGLVSEAAPTTVFVGALAADGALTWAYTRAPQRGVQGDGALSVRYRDARGALLGTAQAHWAQLGDSESGAVSHVFVRDVFAGAVFVEIEGAANGARVRLPGR